MSRPELHIMTDGEFALKIAEIENELEKQKTSGYMQSFDGKKIYYEYFMSPNAAATVVIVHGLSEFIKKYYELAYYFLQSGYNVFIFDQRCHGYSDRLTDQLDLIHVDSFGDYVADLSQFINEVVKPQSAAPIYIFSHSMGGAVSAMYLAKNGEQIKKAVLSAPLFEPQVGSVPYPIARLGTRMKALVRGKKSKFRAGQKFNPERAQSRSSDPSRERFLYNLELRKNEPRYQSTPLTSGWICNALKIYKDMKRQRLAERIKTPVLLISAENDTVVKTDRQKSFAAECEACTLKIMGGCGHSLMTETHEKITEYIESILSFYRD